MGHLLTGIIPSMGVSDVLDILIVFYAVYKLIGFMRSTRAMQLAVGILLLVVAFLLSSALKLYTVNWMLSKILDIGLIALVVVFQPELRRGLEFIGRGKFMKKNLLAPDSVTELINSIVRAVEYFSARKEGALIVIERNTALNEYAESGTIIDSALSEQLLENIFYKGSPLHDGAVIIRAERIYAAACVLPLTSNPNLSKDLGTRHRAGIGITEVSDALVIIVSEETGIISMASDGKLSRFLDPKTVEKTLLNYYYQREARPDLFTFIVKTVKEGLRFGKKQKNQDI